METGILFPTAYARSVRRSPAGMHEDAPLVNGTVLSSSQVKSSLLNTRLQLKAELIHTETIEKCYA